MLVIRLQRTGRRNLPSYRLIVAEKARAAKGKSLETMGHYLPARENPIFEFDVERITHWVSKGAQPSDTVARMLKKNGVKNMEKFIKRYAKQKSKSAEPEAEAGSTSSSQVAPVPAPAAKAPAETEPAKEEVPAPAEPAPEAPAA